MWIFFALPTSHTYVQFVILPLVTKAWAKGRDKGQFPGWDTSKQLMSTNSCSTVSSTLINRYLLVYRLHLKLVVSKKFYADCSGWESGLRRVLFSSSLHLGPWVKRHTMSLGNITTFAIWFRKTFCKWEVPLAHRESEACPFRLANPKTHNPRWCCIIRFHWIRSEMEENSLLEGRRNPSADSPYAVLMDRSDY